LNYDLDWKTAGDRFRRAIELEPNYATAHHWYAEYLGSEGRFDEAFAEITLARKLDPRSIIMAVDHAYLLLYARRYDDAIEQFRAALAVEPRFGRAIGGIIGAYVQQGRFTEALAEAQRWQELDDGPWPWSALGAIYARLGEREKAQQALRKMEEACRRLNQDPRGLRWGWLLAMDRKRRGDRLDAGGLRGKPSSFHRAEDRPRLRSPARPSAVRGARSLRQRQARDTMKLIVSIALADTATAASMKAGIYS
jgi:tetratricopeptide (TPR) repeat protein